MTSRGVHRKMSRVRLLACVALVVSTAAFADPPPGGTPPPVRCGVRAAITSGALSDGSYVALEPIAVLLGAARHDKGTRWFHEVVVTIVGGKVATKESPVVYKRGKRHDSVSDGGFYDFEGCLEASGDHYTASVRLMSCDYCRESKVDATKTLVVAPRGSDIVVNGKRYRRRPAGIRSRR